MATELPPLEDVQRLSPLVIRILGGNPGKFTLQGTNTYLIGTGSTRLLIDTAQGRPQWSTRLSTLLASEACTIGHAFLTHWHHDHVDGVPSLLSLCPNAQIHKHTPSSPSQHPIASGQIFQTQGATLRAFHCPGHTDDHMAFVLEEEDAMFTGDNVLGHGTAVFEDLQVYLQSLERMKGEFAGRAYPGHGDWIADGRARIEDYIRHRQMREEEVLRVLRELEGVGGVGRTPMEVVKVVYRDVPENLYAPAEGGVEQVLRKLEREGKVGRREEGRWVVLERATL